jgi:alkaline phosphatase
MTVPMWVYGMDPPKHLIENVDVGKMVARAMGVNLTEMTAELFVDLDTTDLDYTVNTSDPTNPFATVQGFVFPLGTDYFLDDDRRIMLPGVTIYAPMTKKLYISEFAIQKLDEMDE